MLTTIHITVRDRVPTITAGEDVISHNSDYAAEFEFDEEWQDKVKTVFFVCEDGSYQAVVMNGNSCGVPMLDGEHRRIFVGVQAGAAEKPSILKTTRPCCLKVKDSIADYLGQPIPDPPPSVYEQIITMLNNLTSPTWDSVQDKPFSTLGSGLSVDENGVLSAEGGSGGSANAVQYVAQTLTDEQKAQARKNIGAGTSSFSGSYNDLTSKPTIPTQVTIDSTLKQSGQAADAKAVGDALQNYVTTDEWDEILPQFEQALGTIANTKLDKNQGTANAGKILGIGADGIVVPQDKPTYTLPQATADALGGIKADAATAEDTQVVRIGADGKLRTKPTGGSSITVDSALSSTSVNPVQNKIVMAALAEKITAPTTAAVGQIIKVKSVDTSGKPTEWEAVTAKLANPNALTFTGAVTGSYDGSAPLSVEIPSGGGGSSTEPGYKDSAELLDVTLDDTTGGLKNYEYDVSGIEKTDVIIISILLPASYSGQITIKNQSGVELTRVFPIDAKGMVIGLKTMNGRYMYSCAYSGNTASRINAPLSLFYGQLSGASGFERPKAPDTITKLKFTLSVAFVSGTRIRAYRW